MANNPSEILKEEKQILEEERKILREVKKEERIVEKSARRTLIAVIVLGAIIVGGAAGFFWWNLSSQTVAIDKAEISAPLIDLAPQIAGTLAEVFIREGDEIGPDTPVARVGDEIIKSKIGGEIVSVHNDIGTIFNPGTPVVTMIDPNSLRAVGHLQEDKGLQYVHVGQLATFTVDAFGSKIYYGTVDEVSPSSRQTDVVFNISDQRPTNEFDIKIRFDLNQYPELKNGMSARIWIYK